MSGGSREAGSPTQPASLSSSAFPTCFREQCIPCRPSRTGDAARLVLCTRAGNPAAVPCRVLLPVHVGCRTVPASHLLRGDLGRPLHRCEGWREENAACLGRSLHRSSPVQAGLLLRLPRWHIWPQQDTCAGQTGWRAPEEALGERTALPAAGLALSHSQLSWGRVNTCLEHPAAPGRVSRYSIWKRQLRLLKCVEKNLGQTKVLSDAVRYRRPPPGWGSAGVRGEA